MPINLTNPITENLTVEQLAGRNDDCYMKRTGYEVLADDEIFALIPQAPEGDMAKIGETVTVSSFGLPRRAQVVRVLSGYENSYIEQTIVGETENTYKIWECTFSQSDGINERNFEIEKDVNQVE